MLATIVILTATALPHHLELRATGTDQGATRQLSCRLLTMASSPA